MKKIVVKAYIFYFDIFQPKKMLKQSRKMLFILPKNVFYIPKIFIFFNFPLPLFSPIQPFLNLQKKPSENKF